MSETAAALKLVALDGEDLAVISAHVQDSCVQRDEMTYLPAQKRFAGTSGWGRCFDSTG